MTEPEGRKESKQSELKPTSHRSEWILLIGLPLLIWCLVMIAGCQDKKIPIQIVPFNNYLASELESNDFVRKSEGPRVKLSLAWRDKVIIPPDPDLPLQKGESVHIGITVVDVTGVEYSIGQFSTSGTGETFEAATQECLNSILALMRHHKEALRRIYMATCNPPQVPQRYASQNAPAQEPLFYWVLCKHPKVIAVDADGNKIHCDECSSSIAFSRKGLGDDCDSYSSWAKFQEAKRLECDCPSGAITVQHAPPRRPSFAERYTDPDRLMEQWEAESRHEEAMRKLDDIRDEMAQRGIGR